jgi:hypothetical protein
MVGCASINVVLIGIAEISVFGGQLKCEIMPEFINQLTAPNFRSQPASLAASKVVSKDVARRKEAAAQA